MIFAKKKKGISGLLGYVLVLASILGVFIISTNRMYENSGEDGTRLLTEAVAKTAVHCYAIEGQYPKDIEYLEENYGLSYNHDKYTVHYDLTGANLMPSIFVTESDLND
ncbi:MAG: hypothetical protein VB018_03590 [Lachnospiraceae bacterium]|nr:hypothetical protein [Lachnospiraceae bacterium]